MQWPESEHLSKHAVISPRSDSVIVEASINQIERLLKAEYTVFGKMLLLFYAAVGKHTLWAADMRL